MFKTKFQNLAVLAALVSCTLTLANFPGYRSLVGLSTEKVHAIAQSFASTPGAQPLPPPIKDTSAKLVDDPDHPYMPDRPGDIRGPCPGLNTLASHGYIDRSGVATPGEIITAVQEGFNMGYDLATFTTYAAFVVDGSHLTNLMSIGANTTADDKLTPGLNIHNYFEGDASTTRGDYYFGDNHSFNETLFNQLAYAADLVGDGMITIESASLHMKLRIQDSIARNPTFWFETPRVILAYTETSLPLAFFMSNQTADTTLNVTLDNARRFFQDHKYPDGFYRRQGPYGFDQAVPLVFKILQLVGVLPGHNEGAGNYVVNHGGFGSVCDTYQKQVNLTAQLYPDPSPELKAAIKANVATFYQTLGDPHCEQLFPYGH